MAGPLPLEYNGIDQRSEFRSLRVLAEELTIGRGAGAAVAVFVHDSDEAFVEEGVSLARDLHPRANGDIISILIVVLFLCSVTVAQNRQLLTAGRRVDAYNLLVFGDPKFLDGNSQRDQVDVETAL